MSAKTVIFVCHLAYKFPKLFEIVEEHLEANNQEIIPHLLIYEYCLLIIGKNKEEDWIIELLNYLEQHFSIEEDDDISNLIAVSFIENFPFGLDEKHWLIELLGDRMKRFYYMVYPKRV